MMTIHIRSIIANHQTLNQAVYERRSLRAELRRLREPSIRIEIEGNELMPTGCDKQLASLRSATVHTAIRYQT